MSETSEVKYVNGHRLVRQKDPFREIYLDEEGNRWFRCSSCERLIQEDELDYWGCVPQQVEDVCNLIIIDPEDDMVV